MTHRGPILEGPLVDAFFGVGIVELMELSIDPEMGFEVEAAVEPKTLELLDTVVIGVLQAEGSIDLKISDAGRSGDRLSV